MREAAEQNGQGTVVVGVARRARSSLAAAPAFQDEHKNLPIRLYVILRIQYRASSSDGFTTHTLAQIMRPAVDNKRTHHGLYPRTELQLTYLALLALTTEFMVASR